MNSNAIVLGKNLRETQDPILMSLAKQVSPEDLVKQRKLLHEIPTGVHCMVIGTCFTLAEIRKFLRKCRIDIKHMTDYDAHTTAVRCVQDESHCLSRRLNLALNKKFEKDIRFYEGLSAKELLPAWKTSLAEGNIAGPLWALITHPDITHDLSVTVYGDVHMLSHLAGATNRVQLKHLNCLEQKSEELKENQDYWRKEAQTRKLEVEELQKAQNKFYETTQRQEQQIKALKSQVAELKSRETFQKLQEQLHSSEKQLKKLQTERTYLESRLLDVETLCDTLKVQNKQLESSLSKARNENDLLEKNLQQKIPPDFVSHDTNPHFNLGETRILYVGGRSNLLSHYRSLVENHNGSFLYHDGGLEMRETELDQMMSRSDVVVCPTDCVSHNAYFKIKKHCKKNNKCFLMLKSSGLSALNYAIADLQKTAPVDHYDKVE